MDCNTASRVGTWTIALTDPKTHKKSDVHARYSFLYEFEQGQWRIKHLHSSLMPETGSVRALIDKLCAFDPKEHAKAPSR